MKTTFTKNDHYSFATVHGGKSKLVYFKLTTDLHGSINTVNTAATGLFGDLMTSGTKSKSREEFQDALKQIGATLTLSIENKLCHVSLQVVDKHLNKALSLMFEALGEANFPAKELERAKTTFKNKLDQLNDDSRYISHTNLQRELFSKTNRRHNPTLSVITKQLPSVSKKDLVGLKKALNNGYWYATVAGNKQSIESVQAQIHAYKKTSKQRESLASIVASDSKKLVLANIPSRQNIDINIGTANDLHLDHPDYPAFLLGLAVLGKWGGFAGRLMSTVREKEGLTYSIYGRVESLYQHENGYWRVMTFFSPDKVITGLTSTFREIKSIYNKGITAQELKTFKTILETQHVLKNDSLGGQFAVVHGFHLQGLTEKQFDELHEKMQKLTVAQINAALKKYMDPKTLTISCAGPIKSVKKDLQTFAESV